MDRRMIFNLLPNLEVQTLELNGPEHIGLLEGERYLGGFEDAIERAVSFKGRISGINLRFCTVDETKHHQINRHQSDRNQIH